MSSTWRRAPVYVEAHDLGRWLLARRVDQTQSALLPRLCEEALELLGTLAIALTFPAERASALQIADRHIVRLRVFARLAAETGCLRPNGVRHVAAVLDRIGRMVGGWARSLDAPARTSTSGDTP